jgi:hypothetical protein
MLAGAVALLIMASMISSCSMIGKETEAVTEAKRATLYRNSTMVTGMRLHWASFDADDGPSYNISNCMMAARLLNANLLASAEAEGKPPPAGVGFWCEPGSFRTDGQVPGTFRAEYPSDV